MRNLIMILLNNIILPVISFCLLYLLQKKKPTFSQMNIYIILAYVIYFAVNISQLFVVEVLGVRTLAYSGRYTIITSVISACIPFVIIILKKIFGISIVENDEKYKKHIGLYITTAVLLCLGIIILVVVLWLRKNFVFSFQEMLFTLLNPVTGGTNQVLFAALKDCLPIITTYLVFVLYVVILDYKKRLILCCERCFMRKIKKVRLSKSIRIIALILAILTFLYSILFLIQSLGVQDYYESITEVNTLYEDYYINPDAVEIRQEKQKNLLLIYVESFETTYQSVEDGGANQDNYMKNATRLAKENISFSNKDKIGGLRPVKGTTWTMAALFSSLSGAPAMFGGEDSEERTFFVPGIVTLGDILKKYNYNQEFLCGSDASFAGRDKFFEQHGNYEILDLYAAREKGFIPPNYEVWWGFEDAKLYDIAKKELARLSQVNKPFNLTMLTVDTHPIGGYRCELCRTEYEQEMANIVSCADRQLNEFIEWCKNQPFYENTLIVILGDHPRMDSFLVGGVEYLDRTNYNCFINAEINDKINLKKRESTHFDMFPTILSAMGFKIQGNRLGLGVNLFSDLPTIAEEIGIEELNSELKKHSKYTTRFMLPKENQ